MEQRIAKRFDLNLVARAGNGAQTWDCTIRDYCPGGLFLECLESAGRTTDGARRVFSGEQLSVAFVAPGDGGERHRFELVCRVAHMERTGFGVAFVRPDASITRALGRARARWLREHGDQGALAPGRDTVALTPQRQRELLQQLKSSLAAFLEARGPEFVKRGVSLLGIAIGRMGPSPERDDLARVMIQLGDQGVRLVHAWRGGVEAALDEVLSNGAANASGRSNDEPEKFELVDKDSFDQWVIYEGLASKLDGRCERALYALEQRFNQLTGRSMATTVNPLFPEMLLARFRDAVLELRAGVAAQRLLLASLERTVLGDIQVFYDAANRLLAEQGILPQLSYKTQRQPGGEPRRAQAKAPSAPPLVAQVTPREHQVKGRLRNHLFDTLQGLTRFRSRRGDARTDDAAAEALRERPPGVGPEQAAKMLGEFRPEGSEPLVRQLERRLESRGGGEAVGLSEEAKAGLEAAEGLLRSVSNDAKIPAPVQDSVKRLQVPLARMALEHPEFLNEDSSPAAQVINNLESLGVALSAEGMDSRRAGEFQAAIDQALNGLESGSPDDFAAAQAQLAPLATQCKDLFAANLRRVMEGQQGQERLRKAREEAKERIVEHLAERNVPKAVLRLLHLGWDGVLVQTLLHEGDKGPSWGRYLAVLDTFISWFEPDASGPPPEQAAVTAFLKSLEQGLAQAPAQPAKQEQFLNRLRHALGGDAAAFKAIRDERAKVHRKKPDAELPRTPEQAAELQRWVELIDGIKVGDWLVERTERQISRPLSLAWNDEARERFVFVDGKGAKGLECARPELAGHLASGRVSLLEDGGLPLVQRAVQRVLKTTYEKLLHNSDHDELTGLVNRRAYTKALQRGLDIVRSEGGAHVAMVVDVDQFKVINDVCGHEGGDRLLVEISQILNTYLEKGGLLSRIGDDEFGILLESCTREHGLEVAETLRKAIENFTFHWEGRKLSISASVGLLELDPGSESVSLSLKNLDAACSLAKRDGRNRTKLYQATGQDFMHREGQVQAMTLVEEAIQKGRLQLYLQLISPVFLDDGLTEHYEVLLRVLDDKGRPLPPQELIVAAEEYNRMRSLDRWVIEHIFGWLREHGQSMRYAGGFSINLSGQSVDDAPIFELINAEIDRCPLGPERIAFEITETAIIQDMERAKRFINQVRALGCEFYLDDFGSGLASYSYLKDLPVDCVKIDGIFIKNIAEDPNDYALVKSIIGIAHFMKKKVVAEYVENEAIMIRLRELEVDYVQGYQIGRPFPLHHLLEID